MYTIIYTMRYESIPLPLYKIDEEEPFQEESIPYVIVIPRLSLDNEICFLSFLVFSYFIIMLVFLINIGLTYTFGEQL